MDREAREQVEAAAQALEEALQAITTFLFTLRPTLRNEILQLLGHHLEKARQAHERLRAILKGSEDVTR